MATEAERAHARRLLEIHKRNLARLEIQKAELGGELNIALENQIDEERANIALLEPIVKPPPSQSVQAFVTGVSDGNGGNWAMLFSQFVLLNSRMTKQEEQTQRILDEQARASVWRLDIAGRLEDSETARVYGQLRNYRLAIGNLVLLALVAAALWIVLVRAGVL